MELQAARFCSAHKGSSTYLMSMPAWNGLTLSSWLESGSSGDIYIIHGSVPREGRLAYFALLPRYGIYHLKYLPNATHIDQARPNLAIMQFGRQLLGSDKGGGKNV